MSLWKILEAVIRFLRNVFDRTPPEKARHPHFTLEFAMFKARVTANWELSPSTDVAKQILKFQVNGASVLETELDKFATSLILPELASEGDVITGTIETIDGNGNTKGPANFEPATVPDMSAPEPAIPLPFTFEAVEVPDGPPA